MLTLNNLSSSKGANRKIKRIGRGEGSGRGTQAGKGHKGQKARSGGGLRTGFEGGALPLYMKLPKKGFSNEPFKKQYAIVNIGRIDKKFEANAEVNRQTLAKAGLIKGICRRLPIKILAKGSLKQALVFSGISKFSQTAIKAIESAGGKINTNQK
ncbi:MAG: 50S ribosomal protein L15 [Halobacteriovoraceae bacterium]|nr:50S ribosomal protein L15 [Halobacteriovoraceae bacterium]